MSQQLVNLITSLTRNEKRYVTLSLKTFSFDNNTNGLLSDFNKLEKQLGKINIKESFSISGNPTKLYYKLIDILHQFHEDELSNSGSALKNLTRAKVLIFKGHYKEGVKLLDKIITQTSQYDYLSKMEALELKLNCAIKVVDVDYLKNKYPKDKDLFLRIHTEYFNLMEFESMEALIKLESTTLYFYGDDHDISKTYQQLLENEANAFHPLAKIYFNKANAFLSLKRGDFDKALAYAKRTIELFETHTEIKTKNLVNYLKSISNLCLVLLHLKKHKDAEDVLNEAEKTLVDFKKNASDEIRVQFYILFVLIRTNFLISNDLIHENLERIKNFEEEFHLNVNILTEDAKANSYLNFSILNINLKNYRHALKHTIEALKVAGKIRKDLYHISLMNEMVIHYFLGNADVLFSKLAAYKRMVAKGNTMFGFEKDLPSQLTVLFNNPQDHSLYEKLFDTIDQSLIKEGRQVAKPFIALFYLKPI